MKFGIGGRRVPVTNFLSIGQGGSILRGVEFWHSLLTKAVAVNTVLRYRAPACDKVAWLKTLIVENLSFSAPKF